ncbi:hypothetical protein B9Z55_007293 [Caenorhabditis nigoni]|uniref:Uncharacterized protein n=1 Tax=Caenorhabditis nigoni TaxID=1611254 RepID=A0A2G5V8Y3_9PELO|nr:hypothetical protein B9Z55_007293 [Caenorhabditis nigoni]
MANSRLDEIIQRQNQINERIWEIQRQMDLGIGFPYLREFDLQEEARNRRLPNDELPIVMEEDEIEDEDEEDEEEDEEGEEDEEIEEVEEEDRPENGIRIRRLRDFVAVSNHLEDLRRLYENLRALRQGDGNPEYHRLMILWLQEKMRRRAERHDDETIKNHLRRMNQVDVENIVREAMR